LIPARRLASAEGGSIPQIAGSTSGRLAGPPDAGRLAPLAEKRAATIITS